MIKFGPAGNSVSFYNQGHKNTWEAMAWLKDMGLNAYEYSCGRGINIGEEAALKIGEEAKKNGISVSIHAPYFTNLANEYSDKRQATNNYVISSLKLVRLMGGNRVVFHPGAYMKRPPEVAFEIAKEQIKVLNAQIKEQGLDDLTVCPETMGKSGQLGTVDEVLELCSTAENLVPCFDFGHIYARSLGEINSFEQFDKILAKTADVLGTERMRSIHIHFSHIEFTAAGEKRHYSFAEGVWGPDFEPLAKALVKQKAQPVIICESKDTMAEDALTIKQTYNAVLK